MEKEKLFYNLHQTIKQIVHGDIHSSSTCEWITDLYCKLLVMDEKTLNLVLDIYSRLDNHTKFSISSIVCHTDLLKNIFYKDDKFIEEKLILLSETYAEFFYYSPLITEYCFNNHIPLEEFKLFTVMNDYHDMLEKIIKNDNITNSFIVKNLEKLFFIYENSPKLLSTFKLGPLHEMQITIYKKTKTENANSDRRKYIKYLLEFRNQDEKILDKVVDYIKSCEFVEYETVEIIGAMDIQCLDKLIKKYGEKVVLKEILLNPDLRKLSKSSPKLLMKLLNLYFNEDSNGKLIRTAKIFSNMDISQICSIEALL